MVVPLICLGETSIESDKKAVECIQEILSVLNIQPSFRDHVKATAVKRHALNDQTNSTYPESSVTLWSQICGLVHSVLIK